MEWRTRHAQAIKHARQVCRVESMGQTLIALFVAITCLGLLWGVGGQNEAWSEFIAKAGATLGILLIFPIVYVWHLLHVHHVVLKRAPMVLIGLGIGLLVLAVAVIGTGVLQLQSNATTFKFTPGHATKEGWQPPSDGPLRPVWKGKPLAWNDRPGGNVRVPPGGENYATSITMSAFNSAEKEVEIKDAYIISRITGDRRKMLIISNYGNTSGPAEAKDINPIPPGAPVNFWSEPLNGEEGLPEKQFMDKWGELDLVVDFKDWQSVRITFNRDALKQALFPSFQPPPMQPHVTRRTPP